jgi:hypothetical protein
VAEPRPTALRRRLLGAGLVGLAGSLVPRLTGVASAATPSTTPDSTTGGTTGDSTVVATQATTTTAPPKQPQADDVTLLSFAQSLEIAAERLYATALRAGSLGDTTMAIVANVHQAHQSYGQALNALLGRKAPGQALTDVVDQYSSGFGGDNAAFLAAARELEDTAVATHTEILGQLQGTDAASLIASIILAEARHALVFADLAGETDLDALVSTNAEPLQVGKG